MTRSLRVDAVLVQAVIAGALSFAHLHDLAAAAGQTGWKAWAYPVSVDLLLVAAWRRLRNDGPSRLAWCWFLIALVASLGANVATAGFLDLAHPPAWLRFGIAGWPALAFLGGTLLAHSPTTAGPALGPEPEPEPEAVEVVPAEPDSAPEPGPVTEPEPTPALPAAPEPAPAPAPPVPAALVDHARKVAHAHRAATGSPIDTDTLRARLGVPAPMADAIAAQLA
jgi:outer membrane biosynthesis protein TonB